MNKGTGHRVCGLPALVACASVVVGSTIAGAPSHDKLKLHRSPAHGGVTFIEPAHGDFIPLANRIAATADPSGTFLREYGRVMGVRDPAAELVLDRRTTCRLGQVHTTYRQVHQGVPVFSGVIKVHEDAAGRVLAANGRFHRIKGRVAPVPAISRDEAVAAAAATLAWDEFVVERAALTFVDPGWYRDAPSGVHLAYHLTLDAVDGSDRFAFFVDAHTGEVIDRWSDLPAALQRVILDGAGEDEVPEDGARLEGEPPVKDTTDVNRAYDYAGDFYDYFARAFGRDGIDDAGLPMRLLVNSTYGSCPNARWSESDKIAIFCDGLVIDDIVAHELTHGITRATANLVYQNQPGQLNESFSDVFGELVDQFNGNTAFPDGNDGAAWLRHATGPGEDLPNERRDACIDDEGPRQSVRWLIAEELTAIPGPLRDMWAPECEGDPGRALSELQVCAAMDSGGVHSGSGIPNHAFAIVTDGAEFNGHAIRGIGPIKSGAVWYRALTTYLTVASDFEDAYAALNRAADDLIGTYLNDPRTGLPIAEVFTADDAAQVNAALRAVEMDQAGVCGEMFPILAAKAPPICGNRVMVYRADFDEHANGWSVAHDGGEVLPTPYDWVLSESLPFERPGRAWFCDDPRIGDCEERDESAVHWLISPPVALPPNEARYTLSFVHYAETEPGWDGGRVQLSVNGSRWRVVEGTAFLFNTYNGLLRGRVSDNTNPIAGREAFTGIGGGWGTSRIDLSRYASGGDTVEVRFEFGKDGCEGLTGWYIDDVEVYGCGDCDRDGIRDDRLLHFSDALPTLFEPGTGRRLEYTIADPPRAASEVRLTTFGMGDFAFEEEYLTVELNGTPVGTLFAVGAQDCASIPNAEVLTIGAAAFNELTDGADAVFAFVGSEQVSPTLCTDTTYVRSFIDYATAEPDENGNRVPDACERCVNVAGFAAAAAASPGRYLWFTPPATDERVAVRVTLTNPPEAARARRGTSLWVGDLRTVTIAGATSKTHLVAPLSCTPVYQGFGGVEEVAVYGAGILPGGEYEVSGVRAFPGRFDCANWSISSVPAPSVRVATGVWGDVTGAGAGAVDHVCDLRDVTAALEAFLNPASLEAVLRADVFPSVPDQVVDMRDVALILGAALGESYPFHDERACR